MAEALPSLEVALAIDAIAADEGAVLPVCPVPALGFTPGRDEGKWAAAPTALGDLQYPSTCTDGLCITMVACGF